ncbi:AAA family ATPase [Candidatus Desantisbacteria bacterium]|nr:AAA family ATPase [Candidatus Desantisbacteria bacterium]
MSKDNNIITNINEEPHKADMDIFIKQSHPRETSVPDAEREKTDNEGSSTPHGVQKIHFDMLPAELEKYLDQYVIKQNEAKEILSTKICTHFRRIKAKTLKMFPGSIKSNILMIGPTGVGKTYLVKLIADKIGVPFVKSDATKFSETGYVGRDVEDLVRELAHEAGGDIELAEHGIIYVDEIDKIASSGTTYGPDVSRTGVQRNFLKVMEETEVDLKSPSDIASQMEIALKFQKTGKIEKKKINTRNILFIMSGAFNGLTEIIAKRLNKQNIGFNTSPVSSLDDKLNSEILRQAVAEDFITYGFESEFIGRLPVITVLDALTLEDLHEILKNPNSPLVKSKKQDFKSYGINLYFMDEAFHEIAKQTYQKKIGARGLISVMEKKLLKFEKNLPSTNIKKLIVTDRIIENPEIELNKVLNDPDNIEQENLFKIFISQQKKIIKNQIDIFAVNYKKNYNEEIVFSQCAVDLITEIALAEDILINKTCTQIINMRREIHEFEKNFLIKNNISISFDTEAMDLILKNALNENTNVVLECQKIFKNYELGLKLINNHEMGKNFIITAEAVINPESYLNNLIKTSFENN